MKKWCFLCLSIILAVAIFGIFYAVYFRREIEPEIVFDVRFTNEQLRNFNIVLDDVTMTVVDINYNNLVLQIANNSSYTIAYGEEFDIEFFYNEIWERVEVDIAFIHPIYFIPPGYVESFTRYFREYLPLIQPGIYRIVKTIRLDDGSGFINIHDLIASRHDLAAVFIWE